MSHVSKDSFKTQSTLSVNGKTYHYFSLPAAEKAGLKDVNKLPFSLKILLENLLRYEDGSTVKAEDAKALADWLNSKKSEYEIAYRPARVLMQDFTGVPAIVDLAAMRDAMKAIGGNPDQINPLIPVDLVIDHSIQVDEYGTGTAFKDNVRIEMYRNKERYEFLRWGQKAFKNFRVVPPGTGICHQVNLEYLAKVVWTNEINGQTIAYPDTLVGTDSHTTMVNGLGVLGWGVGGIEAEAAMLGQPISMLIPEVIGFRLTGKLTEGVTATDLVLRVTNMLRQKGVVGKFVEFFGTGLQDLPLADRATIANMAPEYGATCGIFPIDKETINYLRLSGRDEDTIALTEAYAKAQGMWADENTADAAYTDILELNLADVVPSVAGPKRPQDLVPLTQLSETFNQLLTEADKGDETHKGIKVRKEDYELHHGDLVIAAITSCTNTSNPSVMIAAGLVAKKALAKGLKCKPWVKTSLAPGSKVVTEYFEKTGLQTSLDELGFNLVGYGCTTCIGNSGPLPEPINEAIIEGNLAVSAILSGNRNFEGRVHPLTKANWLASPPLVVAFALLGHTRSDITKEPIGKDEQGNPVYLKDIWPTNHEIATEVAKINAQLFRKEYSDVFKGDAEWQNLPAPTGQTYTWNTTSTYIQNPPYFVDLQRQAKETISNVQNARILAILGDSITTDHISPAGNIKKDSPAGKYLLTHGVEMGDFNSYGARRGNHEVMMRGTFANIRIRNEMAPGTEGGVTTYQPDGEVMPIYDAAMRYHSQHTPLVIFAGKEYGTGSSRDWAAKGTILLGVKAVIAESFERIHRSNLIGMGVLPLQFKANENRQTLNLDGSEIVDIDGLTAGLKPGVTITATIKRKDGSTQKLELLCRIDTSDELEYYRNDGILQYVLRSIRQTAVA